MKSQLLNYIKLYNIYHCIKLEFKLKNKNTSIDTSIDLYILLYNVEL